MDLTCPSFVYDKTSDYGSRDTSDNDDVIGGLTILAYPQGIYISSPSKAKLHKINLFNTTYFQQKLSSSVEPGSSSSKMILRVN